MCQPLREPTDDGFLDSAVLGFLGLWTSIRFASGIVSWARTPRMVISTADRPGMRTPYRFTPSCLSFRNDQASRRQPLVLCQAPRRAPGALSMGCHLCLTVRTGGIISGAPLHDLHSCISVSTRRMQESEVLLLSGGVMGQQGT